MDPFLQAAIEEARQGMAEGGIPIGSILVIDGQIVGRGHNQRVQKGSATLHAEMDCLENSGRLKAADYRRATLYSTLSPCAAATTCSCPPVRTTWCGTLPMAPSGWPSTCTSSSPEAQQDQSCPQHCQKRTLLIAVIACP